MLYGNIDYPHMAPASMTDIIKTIESSNLSPLAKQVYLLLLTIPKGKVTTYKVLGDALGTKGYRAVGRILGQNPYIPLVPCHRVVASDGRLHGYAGGVEKKQSILLAEGVWVKNGRVLDEYMLQSL